MSIETIKQAEQILKAQYDNDQHQYQLGGRAPQASERIRSPVSNPFKVADTYTEKVILGTLLAAKYVNYFNPLFWPFLAAGCGNRNQSETVIEDAGTRDATLVRPDAGMPDATIPGQTDAGMQPSPVCEEGALREFYDPAFDDKIRVGACKPGIKICENNVWRTNQEPVYPTAEIPCNDTDEDCDGTAYPGTDQDGDGYKTEGGDLCGPVDCSDRFAMIYPGAPELLDGFDNDCDCIVDNRQWVQVEAGEVHACGIRTDGHVECWGFPIIDRQTTPPREIFVQVSSGRDHSCGIVTSGQILCWGIDRNGETQNQLEGTFVKVSAGGEHTCAIRSDDGTLHCWGANYAGQSTPPDGAFIEVAAGGAHSCALTLEGRIQCWGGGPAVSVPDYGSTVFAKITSAGSYACGLTNEGDIHCWGFNNNDWPPNLYGNFVDLSAANNHYCAVEEGGLVYCWGRESHGYAGIPMEHRFTQISAGGGSFTSRMFTCGLTRDQSIYCWGRGAFGVTTPPGSWRIADCGL